MINCAVDDSQSHTIGRRKVEISGVGASAAFVGSVEVMLERLLKCQSPRPPSKALVEQSDTVFVNDNHYLRGRQFRESI